MERVGARELKQHTGAVIDRVQRGERLLVTNHGMPVALLVPIDQAALDEMLTREAARAEALGWLQVSQSAFSFWDSPEDDVWDTVEASAIT